MTCRQAVVELVAIGRYLFGRVLKLPHITRAPTRGYLVALRLRDLEERFPSGFGLSTIVIGRRHPRGPLASPARNARLTEGGRVPGQDPGFSA